MSAAFPALVADVGGTNARFGWVPEVGGPVQHVRVLAVSDHVGPASAVERYLRDVAASLGAAAVWRPRSAAFAFATMIHGDRVELTNGCWGFSREALRIELGLETLLALNDFEALALSLPELMPSQLRAWRGEAQPAPATGTLAVIGPGTGLGVAGVVHGRNGWVALPGEGGHATLAAADGFESAILAAARAEFAHVSAERLLSGIGLPVLHKAVAAVRGEPAKALTTAQIVALGLSAESELASATLDAFCALLGGFAGNVALTLGARGGVYIGGGIVPRLGERFFTSKFRERFEAKGRFQPFLASIPTPLITDTLAALVGAGLALAQHEG